MSTDKSNYLLTGAALKQRKKDGKYVSETIDEPLKSILNKDGRFVHPLSIIQIVSSSLDSRSKRKLSISTMITKKNRADFITVACFAKTVKGSSG